MDELDNALRAVDQVDRAVRQWLAEEIRRRNAETAERLREALVHRLGSQSFDGAIVVDRVLDVPLQPGEAEHRQDREIDRD